MKHDFDSTYYAPLAVDIPQPEEYYHNWDDLNKDSNMNINEMKQSKYLKKEDIKKDTLVTINDLTQDNVAMQNQEPDMKYLLHFDEFDKPLVLNWSNTQLCAVACSSENTDEWMGRKVVLYVDPTIMFGGKVVGGIRIRPAKNQSPKVEVEPDFNDDINF